MSYPVFMIRKRRMMYHPLSWPVSSSFSSRRLVRYERSRISMLKEIKYVIELDIVLMEDSNITNETGFVNSCLFPLDLPIPLNIQVKTLLLQSCSNDAHAVLQSRSDQNTLSYANYSVFNTSCFGGCIWRTEGPPVVLT